MSKLKKLIVIGGPTGVGKSSLAMKLAKQLDCPIICADSRQVYKEMSIGTAKPSEEDLATIQHYCVNHVSIHDTYNAGTFDSDCTAAIRQISTNHQYAIMCGGTGLYIQAFLDGMDDFPKIPEEIRTYVNTLMETQGIDALRTQLSSLDPKYLAEVDVSNHRRLARALEVCLVSGKPYSSFKAQKVKKQHNFEIKKYWLNRNRDELYNRINRRVDIMMDQGWLAEAKELLPYRHIKALDTVGYKELFQYLDGTVDMDTCLAEIKKFTRRYAKRQITWFGNQFNGQMIGKLSDIEI